ncbi:hypothetical protein B1218_36135, partial [Pseudomonas ogarae]
LVSAAPLMHNIHAPAMQHLRRQAGYVVRYDFISFPYHYFSTPHFYPFFFFLTFVFFPFFLRLLLFTLLLLLVYVAFEAATAAPQMKLSSPVARAAALPLLLTSPPPLFPPLFPFLPSIYSVPSPSFLSSSPPTPCPSLPPPPFPL